MTGIRADRETYGLERRYVSKKGQKPLKGFALDTTIRFNTDGVPFVQDHNSKLGPMPFDSVEAVAEFVRKQIIANHREHFQGGRP